MWRRVLFGLAVIVAVGVVNFRSWAQEREVSLRLKFSPKQVRIYEHQISGESVMTLKPPDQQEISFKTKMRGSMTHRERIDEVNEDGSAAVTMTLSGNLKPEMTEPAEGPMPPEFEIQPISVRFKINPLGKVGEVKMDIDELRNRPPTPMPISMFQMHCSQKSRSVAVTHGKPTQRLTSGLRAKLLKLMSRERLGCSPLRKLTGESVLSLKSPLTCPI